MVIKQKHTIADYDCIGKNVLKFLVKTCIYFIPTLFCTLVGYWFGRRKWNAFRSTVYSYQMEDVTFYEKTTHKNIKQNIPYTDDLKYEEQIKELEFRNILLQAKLRRVEEDLEKMEGECQQLKKILADEK